MKRNYTYQVECKDGICLFSACATDPGDCDQWRCVHPTQALYRAWDLNDLQHGETWHGNVKCWMNKEERDEKDKLVI